MTDSDAQAARRALRRIRVPRALDVAALGASAVLFVLAAVQLASGRLGDAVALTLLAAAVCLAGAGFMRLRRASR